MIARERLPLAGLRVIDSTDGRGELCGRLLADLGADVVRAEPPGGSASRQVPPFAPDGRTSLPFAVRNTNKRAVTVDRGDAARLDALLAGADVWVTSDDPGDVPARHPRLIVTSITDFGLSGPYRDFVGSDPVIVAMAGTLFRSGVPERPPLLPPGRLAYDVAGTTAAFATLAAYRQRRETGAGQHIDASALEALAQITDWGLANYSAISNNGGLYGEARAGSGPVYPLYRCADGYVRLVVLSTRQWRAFRAWLGEPEILQDEHWDHLLSRLSIQTDILDPLYAEFFADKSAADLAAEAQRRGIVMTPVLSPAEVLTTTHYRDRGTFADAEAAPGVHGPLVSGFFEIDGERVGYRAPAPAPGEHDGEDLGAPTTPGVADAPRPAPAYPFSGLKVLDFGHGGVGVETGRLFAEYGADVVKVETRTYPDFIRLVAGSEMSPSFASSSRCKRSFGVNVKTPQGLDIARRLVGWADVVIENGSTGTIADMGLGYDVLRDINPRVVLASSQLMGSTGAWKDWIGYGPNTRTAGGMTYLWNFDDGGMPPGAGVIHPDHLVGRMLAVGVLAALIGRDEHRAGGMHLEVAQVETVIGSLADYFLAEGLTPGSVRPRGNSSPCGAPWGVYPCAGEQRWCVVTVRTDEEWAGLRRALGDPGWAGAPEYADAAGRLAHRDELDRRLAEWTAQRADRDVMETLQAAGVPAGMMMATSDVAADPHLAARGYLREIDQPGVGRMTLEGPAFHATGMPDAIAAPAPALGEHTREIARAVLGMTDDEVDKLIADGVLEGPSQA